MKVDSRKLRRLHVEHVHDCSAVSKSLGHRRANAAATAGDDRYAAAVLVCLCRSHRYAAASVWFTIICSAR
jgi:hypothetical protein